MEGVTPAAYWWVRRNPSCPQTTPLVLPSSLQSPQLTSTQDIRYLAFPHPISTSERLALCNHLTFPAQPYFLQSMQVKKQLLELDKEQQTGSKLGKHYAKAVYCHSGYLTYMKSISCKILGWMKHKLESRLHGEISVTSDMNMTPLLWQKAKRN